MYVLFNAKINNKIEHEYNMRMLEIRKDALRKYNKYNMKIDDLNTTLEAFFWLNFKSNKNNRINWQLLFQMSK